MAQLTLPPAAQGESHVRMQSVARSRGTQTNASRGGFASRAWGLFLGLLSLVLAGAPRATAAPSLLVGPSASDLRFTFSEPMSAADIDITWEGAGIDPSKFVCAWVTNLFGFPLPAFSLECSYTGGLPGGIDVTYTLNKGNSGRIKSEAGQALPETSGTFHTEGGSGGPCDGSDTNAAIATIAAFKEIPFLQTSAASPMFDTERKATMNASVASGTNIPPVQPTSATLRKPDGSTVDLAKISFDFPDLPGIPTLPDSFFLSTAEPPEILPPTFDSEAGLNAAYPNGDYRMVVGLTGGGTVTVDLPIDPNPDVPTPHVINYGGLQGFDPAQPLTIQWEAFTAAVTPDSIQLEVSEKGGGIVFSAPDPCNSIELAPTATSITIPANRFQADTTYELELRFTKVTHNGADTVQGFHEFAGLSRSTRMAMGAPDLGPGTAEITAAKVETTGAVTLTIEGTITSPTAPVAVEGSTDLESWSTATTVTKAQLDAAGGHLDVLDSEPATTPTPYKFYRLAFP